jgi:hypothetical protein
MRTHTPSLAMNRSKEIGLFVSAISSLYIRPQYIKPLALVKNPFDLDHCHPAALEAARCD